MSVTVAWLMVGVSTSNTPRSAKKRRISAIIAARFNKLAMGALGCQLAVSLMVVNSEIKQGMQSTRISSFRQISLPSGRFLCRIQHFTL
ncbi:Uncharacterised protein [Yersinia massiliensis]|nr:Uncharacterised protein [Yersinia massiliensis]